MRIAFIGLGAMGLPIARRMAGVAGAGLHLYDTAPDRLALADGIGRAASSVGQAVQDADIVITVLPADRHVRAVASEVAEAGRPGQVLVDLSTIAPDTMDEVADQLALRGIDAVSAAMTRGTAAAERGELALFVGTSDGRLPERVRRALNSAATELYEVTGLAGAKALKIANNMVLGCIDITIAEALVLGHACGVAPERITDALAVGGADSWALHNQIERHVLTDRLGAGLFGTRYMAKDMALHLELAARVHAPAFMAAVAAAAYRGVMAGGMSESYHPIVVRWFERIAYSDDILKAPSPRPGAWDEGRVIPALVAGVAATLAVIVSEALHALAGCGVPPHEAVRCLRNASAGNDQLEPVADRVDTGGPVLDEDAIVSLDRVLELCAAVQVPGVMAEVARQAARSSRRAA